MSSDDRGNAVSDIDLSTVPIGNGDEQYLDKRLDTLREKYSFERLSGLSTRRLRGSSETIAKWTEEDELYRDFRRLRSQYPPSDSLGTDVMTFPIDRKLTDYQRLSPLTIEEKQRIRDCQTECIRNLDRAMQEAIEAEQASDPVSRFASWFTEVTDAATPVFGRMR
jgi:hypothetical protein